VIVDVSLIRCFSSNFILQLLLKLEDNRLVETVGIPVEDDKGSARLTACVSSQVFVLLMNHFFSPSLL
jgi:adenine C2-methylase RlmN of 23S rRNA A2503 and tRNA A37